MPDANQVSPCSSAQKKNRPPFRSDFGSAKKAHCSTCAGELDLDVISPPSSPRIFAVQTQAVLPKPQAPHKPFFSDGKGSPSHRQGIFRRWWENVSCANTFDCISAEPSLRIDGRLSNHGSFPGCPGLFRASYLQDPARIV